MTERTNKTKLPKYSSYLNIQDEKRLTDFCDRFNCSKAKALSLLLSFWHDNKDNVSNELATISSEDISVKKYDERLATIEDKLANISYDTELATIQERLAILENMLATIANEDLAPIDIELATISNELATNEQLELMDLKEETTKDSTLPECDILPIETNSPQTIPNKELTANNEDISTNDAVEVSIEVVNEDNSDNEGITKEMVKELLHKHHLTFTGVVKNTAVLLPFLTELNQLQNKEGKITANNISKVAKKEDKHYFFPPALWECLEVENKGTEKKASYVWAIK